MSVNGTMFVKEAAEYFGVPLGQLLDTLKTRFPAEKITPNSELPVEFVEYIESLSNKVQDSTPNAQPKPSAGGMGMGLAKTSAEAITNTKATSLSVTQCIREALEDAELVLAIQQGFRDALVIEDAYQTAKNEALGAMIDCRVSTIQEEVERVRAERESLLIDRAAREQDSLGKWVRRREDSRQRLQQVQDELAALRNLF